VTLIAPWLRVGGVSILQPRMRILHVITNLAVGGAEVMLHGLLGASSRGDASHEVVSLTEVGVVGERIRALGIDVRALGMRREGVRLPDPVRVARLVALIRAARPDVVQTWLYHADLLGGVAAKLAGGTRIFWGIHNSTLDATHTRRTTRWTVAACARLSRWVPDGIVTVSRAARDLHVAAGYDPRKFVVIPNGFDVTRFRPDAAARHEVREELGLTGGAVAIGLVARVDPQKDHANFVRAAALLAARRPEVRFVLCGEGAARENAELVRAIAERGVLDRFLLLGRRSDVPRVMNALDVATLSSAYGEAFPLAIGEAMSCGVPGVVTDLGDCAHLVGDTGRVVPPRDPEALARAWEALVRLGPGGRRRLGLVARERIALHFTLPRVAEQYAALYRRTLPGDLAHGPA
jgi:glycosyltransferase involved in cell wall biosynthesis